MPVPAVLRRLDRGPADRFGKFPTFCFGTVISVIMVIIWTNIGHLALAWVIVINVLLFAGIFSRMIPAQALLSSIPGPAQRGAFDRWRTLLEVDPDYTVTRAIRTFF